MPVTFNSQTLVLSNPNGCFLTTTSEITPEKRPRHAGVAACPRSAGGARSFSRPCLGGTCCQSLRVRSMPEESGCHSVIPGKLRIKERFSKS